MSYSNKIKWFIIGIFLFAIGIRYAYYAFTKYDDKSDRPWAYENTSGHRLTGIWKGKVTDPDGIVQEVEMEIINPFDEEKEKKRIFSKRIKRDRSDKSFFEGTSTIKWKGKIKDYEVWGGLREPNETDLHFQWRPLDDEHLPGFNLNLAKGSWEGDQLKLSIEFSFFTKEGFSRYESDNPKHNQLGTLVMKK